MSIRLSGLAVAAILTLTACNDRLPSTAPVGEPPAEVPGFARVRGTVDVVAGTLTFETPSAHASLDASRPSAAIYGDQGVTVRIYNSPVVVSPAGPGKKHYSADVGVQNLLAYPIGDEEAATPAHNLGIFVFVSAGPTVTGTSSPCSPACTVTVDNHHGVFPFTATGQRYWFWPEHLTAAGQLGDTTTNRNTWTFEADTQVTAFQFDVLVSAAWPPPHESRWTVNYQADSVPNDGAEPLWLRQAQGQVNTSMNTPQFGMITVNVTSAGARLLYTRADSLASNTDAYIEANFRVNFLGALTAPEISFGLDDRTKFIAMGATTASVGFLNASLNFSSSTAVTTTNFNTYRLRKFGADSVVLYVNGVRRLQQAYSTFPAPLALSTNHGFYFGPLGSGANPVSSGVNSSAWDYVIYEIGVTQP